MYLRRMALVLVTAGLAACQNSYQKTPLPYGAATGIIDRPVVAEPQQLMYDTAPCKPGCSGTGNERVGGNPLNSALYVGGNSSSPLPQSPFAPSPAMPPQFMPQQPSVIPQAPVVAGPAAYGDDGDVPRRHRHWTRSAPVVQPAPVAQPAIVQPAAVAQPAVADKPKPLDPKVRQALQPVPLPKNYKIDGNLDLTKAPVVPNPSVPVPSNIAPTDYNRLAVPLSGNPGGAASERPGCQGKTGGSCGTLVPLPGSGSGAGASGLTPATLGGALAPQPAN